MSAGGPGWPARRPAMGNYCGGRGPSTLDRIHPVMSPSFTCDQPSSVCATRVTGAPFDSFLRICPEAFGSSRRIAPWRWTKRSMLPLTFPAAAGVADTPVDGRVDNPGDDPVDGPVDETEARAGARAFSTLP